jgi:carbon storage regulator
MLVITRKKGESILIGKDVEIIVIKLDDGSVKLAIEAPKNIVILRKELYKEVQDENRHATEFNLDMIKSFKNKK